MLHFYSDYYRLLKDPYSLKAQLIVGETKAAELERKKNAETDAKVKGKIQEALDKQKAENERMKQQIDEKLNSSFFKKAAAFVGFGLVAAAGTAAVIATAPVSIPTIAAVGATAVAGTGAAAAGAALSGNKDRQDAEQLRQKMN